VPKVSRDVENDVLVTALAGATTEELQPVSEFMLANLSKRVAATLSEEIAERPTPKPKEAEAAQRAVIDAIRALVNNGEIKMVEPDED
jgi:flagellar motor switch protein FliG